MSHDQNFKNLILDYPRHALDFFAGLFHDTHKLSRPFGTGDGTAVA